MTNKLPSVRRPKNNRTNVELSADARRLIDALKWAFELGHWSVHLVIEEGDSFSPMGTCSRAAKYSDATITLYASKLGDDEDDFWDTLFHEFAHVVLAEFADYASVVEASCETGTERRLLDSIFSSADERTVQLIMLTWVRTAPTSVKNLGDLAKYYVDRFEAN